MKLTILPKTKNGWYSVICMAMSIALVILINIISEIIGIKAENNNAGFFGIIPLALMTLGVFAFAIISLMTGLMASVKNKERSIFVYICILYGVLAIYFGISAIVGEITGTH